MPRWPIRREPTAVSKLEIVRDPVIDQLLRRLRQIEEALDDGKQIPQWPALDRERRNVINEIKARTATYPKMRYSQP
jgi:hypothetical protein